MRAVAAQQQHSGATTHRGAVDAAHLTVRAGIVTMTTALIMCVLPYMYVQMFVFACARSTVSLSLQRVRVLVCVCVNACVLV